MVFQRVCVGGGGGGGGPGGSLQGGLLTGPPAASPSAEKGKKDLRVLASDANFAIVYVQREMKGMPPSRSLQLYSG